MEPDDWCLVKKFSKQKKNSWMNTDKRKASFFCLILFCNKKLIQEGIWFWDDSSLRDNVLTGLGNVDGKQNLAAKMC